MNYSQILAQSLPHDRYHEWSKAGYSAKVEFIDTVDVLNNGMIADGITSNDEALKNIFQNIQRPSVILFPPGEYIFENRIIMNDNIILKGSGYQNTKLIFDLGGTGDLIYLSGSIDKDTFLITSNIHKFDTIIYTNDGSNLHSGDLIYLFDNDDNFVTSDWAANSTGQICVIDAVEEDYILLDSRIRRDYNLSDKPRFLKIKPIANSGIEELTIKRLDATSGQTSNININYAYNCFIKCIESINCNFAHIEVNKSSKIQIEGSYFHHAFAYGGGGQGYGVMLQYCSGNCLVYNNIFEHLRHSMILQSGANGNVFAYNYSIDPNWTGVSLPSNSAGDAVLHGNYPYANLFEGNVCQNIVIDDSHGMNGPDNTFFRNRAELYGIFMNNNPASDNQNFIGNEITSNEFLKGLYFLNGSGHFEFGNNIKGEIIPDGTNDLTDKTYCFEDIPEWYSTNSLFPPIGIPNKIGEFTIEAESRYTMGKYTACEYEETNVDECSTNKLISIFPNPAEDYLYIRTDHKILDAIILDVFGSTHKIKSYVNIDLKELPSGYYILKIIFSDKSILIKPFIKIQ